jgi:hypothetical protein
MPPRRPPRRGRSYGLPGAPALADIALKDLRRAHTLMERGDHANAAVLLERQARDAGDRGLLLPAAHLHLQAGRARLLAGESEVGEKHIRRGLEILANTGDPRRLAKSGNLILKDLARLDQLTLAEEIRVWLGPALADTAGAGKILDPVNAHFTLPLKCPQCGAILRAEDIEHEKSGSPLCVYCGSLIDA